MTPLTARARSAATAFHRLVAMVAIVFAGACARDEPITIGVPLGVGENNAVQLALAEAERDGLPVQIKPMFIVSADTRAAPALQAAERLTAVPGLIAVVG